MHVLMVVPRYSSRWGEFYQFPLGLGYIASAMKKAGHTVSGLNLNHCVGDIEDLVAAKITEVDPDMCATGGLSPFLSVAQSIFNAARRTKPSILNLAGGGMVAGEPGVIMDVMDIDYGVVGEGEETIVELLDCIENDGGLLGVQGILFRDEAGVATQTLARPQMSYLGDVAWPDYDLLDYGPNIENQRPLDSYFFHVEPNSRPRALDMITSRSCPFMCTFCFHPSGKTYRERPLDDFFAELDMLVERFDINMVALIDELFSLKKRRLLEFCERIKPYNLSWMVQLHVNSASDETIAAMRDAGCVYISYGIESMSQPVLESMQKKSKTERIEYALNLTYQNEIGIQGNLLFGDTAETLDTANESMHWWASNRHYQINLTPLIVFPGSPDYLEALEDGMIDDRVAYVNNIPEDFNISSMNNKNMEMVRFMVWVFSYSLLNMAPLDSFSESDEQVSDRDTAYDISWHCPRCDHDNTYQQVILPQHQSHSVRLSCRSCKSRWDLENVTYVAPVNSIDDEACDQKLQEAQAMFDAGKLGECHDLTNALMKQAPSYVPARLLMGRFYAKVGPAEHMIKSYGAALGLAPLDPERHCDFAEALLKVEAYGAAYLHYSQARDLNPENQRARDGLAHVDGLDLSEAQRSAYFVSWSEDAAPERLRQKAAGTKELELA